MPLVVVENDSQGILDPFRIVEDIILGTSLRVRLSASRMLGFTLLGCLAVLEKMHIPTHCQNIVGWAGSVLRR